MTFAEVMDKHRPRGHHRAVRRDVQGLEVRPLARQRGRAAHRSTAASRRPMSGHPKYNVHANDIDFQIESDFIGLMTPGLPREANKYADRVGRVMNYGRRPLRRHVLRRHVRGRVLRERPAQGGGAGPARRSPRRAPTARSSRDVLAWSAPEPRRLEEDLADSSRTSGTRTTPARTARSQPFNIDAKLNGAYVALGLLYGRGDFAKTLEVSTRAGQDSDCNPSSAAGILGVMLGYDRIPDVWKAGIPASRGHSASTSPSTPSTRSWRAPWRGR